MDTSPCSASHWLVIPVCVASVRERSGHTAVCLMSEWIGHTAVCPYDSTPLGSPCAALLPRRIGIHGKTSPPHSAPKHCLPRFHFGHRLVVS